jgi:hypothetical protein
MPNDIGWIKTRIVEARQPPATVTDAVAKRLESLLSGPLAERHLSSRELSKVGKDLLADMAVAPPGPKSQQ